MFEQLTQWLGSAERATYASWLLMAIGGLIALYLLILVIRVLMRGRINMSRSDRRNRPPRLGVTDFFNIDKEGRRLVIVRRDNVEHLIMIGGPNNDVLIESNITRNLRNESAGNGEGQARPTIAVRSSEPAEPAQQQLAPPPPQVQVLPPKPVAPPVPRPAPVQSAPVPQAAPPAMPQPVRPAPPAVPPSTVPPAPVAASPAPQRLDPPLGTPLSVPPRPAGAAALTSVTERLNANLKTIIPPSRISPKPADPIPAPVVAGADANTTSVDLEAEMARLLGKPGGGS